MVCLAPHRPISPINNLIICRPRLRRYVTMMAVSLLYHDEITLKKDDMDKLTAYIQAIRDVYPDIAIETTQFDEHGQFNDILIVNEESIFRFPKTEREATKLVDEIALLRSLQNCVTLPVPNPIYRSAETAPVGQNFMGYRLLAGEPFWPQTFYAIKDEGLLQHL